MNLPTIHSTRTDTFTEFLALNDFEVEALELNVFKVTRDNELPVFLSVGDEALYFEVDLGSIKEIAGEQLYLELLSHNTEILPVSFGINTDGDEPHLVLVESRVHGDLSDNELLSIFDALELAADKAEALLTQYVLS